jgi:hypothetical protein
LRRKALDHVLDLGRDRRRTAHPSPHLAAEVAPRAPAIHPSDQMGPAPGLCLISAWSLFFEPYEPYSTSNWIVEGVRYCKSPLRGAGRATLAGRGVGTTSVMDCGRFGPEIRRLDRRRAIGESRGQSDGRSRLTEVSGCGRTALAVPARYIAFGASPNGKSHSRAEQAIESAIFCFHPSQCRPGRAGHARATLEGTNRFLIVRGGKVDRMADRMQHAGFDRAAADGGYYLGDALEPVLKGCPILFTFLLRTRRQLGVE